MTTVDSVPPLHESALIPIADRHYPLNGEVIGVCGWVTSPRQSNTGRRRTMISIGIDTHEKMHYVEAQNERQQVMWHGSISNNREGVSLNSRVFTTINL